MINDEFLKQVCDDYLQDEEDTTNERIERLIELNSIFGPQGGRILIGGTQASLALHEVANSYVSGNYMAVILLAQAFIEHSLSAVFALSGKNTVAESSFKKIIEVAKEQNVIDSELFEKLDELRKIRNPYVHAKAGFKTGCLDKIMLDSGYYDSVEFAKANALRALHILYDFTK